jgi:GcrA cell cycle regulator
MAVGKQWVWTPEMDATLKRLWVSDCSKQTIGTELGMHRHTISDRAGFLGLGARCRAPISTSAIFWPAERSARLIDMWTRGLSSSEIARELGVTKNAVVGRVRRLNLPWRRQPKKHNIRVSQRGVLNLDSWPAKDGCLFPIGHLDQPDFHFCGQPQTNGLYCAAHAAICYVPVRQKKVAA